MLGGRRKAAELNPRCCDDLQSGLGLGLGLGLDLGPRCCDDLAAAACPGGAETRDESGLGEGGGGIGGALGVVVGAPDLRRHGGGA